jgi:23S rRNA pseudouridine1911/1915/1917 synthase
MKPLVKNQFTVSEEEIDRLDKLLSTRFSPYSRTYFQYLIEKEAVLLNGGVTKKRRYPLAGDQIEVTFLPVEDLLLEPEPLPLDILYEDEEIISINKPAGMVVHPAPGHLRGTFVHALLHHCKTITLPGKEYRPGIVHRLDKETSGVLIAAKTPQAHEKLVEQFKNREIDKEYLAITVGHPPSCTIEAPIGRHRVRRKEMAVLEERGKPATTIVTPLKRGEHFSLISAKLITGRTHQIRVHLKHRGTPILGDSVYGSPKLNAKYQINRQLLHAFRLTLSHPITQKPLSLSAPLPEDMKNLSEVFFMQNVEN